MTYWYFFSSYLKILSSLITIFLATIIVVHETEAACPTSKICREELPAGKLLHALQSNSKRVWISPCQPNTLTGGHDLICEDIVNCQSTGGFGKFIQAVSGNCKSKTFDSYFGLDGLTFGILDWTSDNLPTIFEIYKRRSPEKFDSIFGALNLPFNGMCINPEWVCESNRTGSLNCDTNFRAAFEQSVKDPEFQKGQLEFALRQYKARINKFQNMGLRSQYGLVSMAVIANNLRKTPECKPEIWQQECKDHGNEVLIVDCMLDKYVEGNCRGSTEGTRRRRNEIEQVFLNHKDDIYIEPELGAIESCSIKWGEGSGVRSPGTRPKHRSPPPN